MIGEIAPRFLLKSRASHQSICSPSDSLAGYIKFQVENSLRSEHWRDWSPCISGEFLRYQLYPHSSADDLLVLSGENFFFFCPCSEISPDVYPCWSLCRTSCLVSPFTREIWTFILLKEVSLLRILIISSSPCSLFLLPRTLTSRM